LQASLQAANRCVLSLPALALQPNASASEHLAHLPTYDLVVAVSSYAATAWLCLLDKDYPNFQWPDNCLVATVGEASAQPLLADHRIPNERVVFPSSTDMSQDSEGLWATMEQRLGTDGLKAIKQVLVLRAQSGRDWLTAQFERQGAQVTRLAVYRREAAHWTTDQQQALKRALSGSPANAVMLITSVQSLHVIYQKICDLNLQSNWAQCTFVVIHDRIAEELRTILRSIATAMQSRIVLSSPTNHALFDTLISLTSHE